MKDTDTQTAARDAAAAHNSAEDAQELSCRRRPTSGSYPANGRSTYATCSRAQAQGRQTAQKREIPGRAHAALFAELEPLLDEPTPRTRSNGQATPPGTPTSSCSTKSASWTCSSAPHWRSLHTRRRGLTILAHIVIGNNLGGLELDATTGALIRDDVAELHGCWEGWGGVNQMESKGIR